MLQMHDPTALPRAIPESPIVLAVAETTSSGVVVARLTNVPPTIKRGIIECPTDMDARIDKHIAALGDKDEPDDQ
jgi:hypothetical protein